MTAGASGSGNGTVSYSFTANPNGSSRSGTITIAGQTYTVTQAAATCTYTLSATSASITAAAGTGSAGVTTLTGVFVDGDEQRELDHGDGGRERLGQRHGELLVHGQPERIVAQRDDHDWWSDLHRDTGGDIVQLHLVGHVGIRRRDSEHGQRECHGWRRVRVDGDEQCQLDHGDGWGERIGQRHGQLLVHGQSERIVAQRDDHDCRRRPTR